MMMVSGKLVGVGVDVERVTRFGRFVKQRDHRFLRRVYSSRELAYCFKQPAVAEHLAARWAGKEAIIKAMLGIGMPAVSYSNIEIRRDRDGVPKVSLFGRETKIQVALSLSHGAERAVAFALVSVELS